MPNMTIIIIHCQGASDVNELNTLIAEVHAHGFLVNGIGEWPRGSAVGAGGQWKTDGWAASLAVNGKTTNPWVRGATPEEALRAALAAALKPAPPVDLFG